MSETPPTLQEFEQAKRREIARLNIRLSSIMSRTFHTPENSELLEGEGPDRRAYDMDIVRRWVASADIREAQAEATFGSLPGSGRVGG